jgi:AraC-like DNA-binding protein
LLLSRTYPPSSALASYIRRHYVFEAPLPDDAVIIDDLLSENAFVRVPIRGDWTAEIAPGQWVGAGPAVLFGANGRPFRVRVMGPFTVYGFAIRPSGWKSLFSQSANLYVDRMLPLSDAWGDAAGEMYQALLAAKSDQEIVSAMEMTILDQLDRVGRYMPDEKMAKFEVIARLDSMMRVDNAAAQLGLSVRQMERRCVESFGLTPKAILRRSRFLDMATALRGFSDPSQEELAALRYFDQSHLTREFRHFAGMPPGAFAKANTPLFTAGLKMRDEGKSIS